MTSADAATRNLEHSEVVMSLHALAAAIHDVRVRTREEVARLLHDDVGQMLAMTKLELDPWVREHRSNDSADVAQRVVRNVDRAIEVIRKLSTQLFDEDCDIWALLVRVYNDLGELERRASISGQIMVAASFEELSNVSIECATVAQRVVNEALHNVEKHSGGDFVRISFAIVDQLLHLKVEDNGCSIPPHAEGLGLRVMRKRVEEFNGRLNIVGGTWSGDRGTTVEAILMTRSRLSA